MMIQCRQKDMESYCLITTVIILIETRLPCHHILVIRSHTIFLPSLLFYLLISTFHSLFKQTVLSQEAPRIEGNAVRTRLDVGDHINLTCLSRPSKPTASLQWFVNGKPVSYPVLYLLCHLFSLNLSSRTDPSADEMSV